MSSIDWLLPPSTPGSFLCILCTFSFSRRQSKTSHKRIAFMNSSIDALQPRILCMRKIVLNISRNCNGRRSILTIGQWQYRHSRPHNVHTNTCRSYWLSSWSFCWSLDKLNNVWSLCTPNRSFHTWGTILLAIQCHKSPEHNCTSSLLSWKLCSSGQNKKSTRRHWCMFCNCSHKRDIKEIKSLRSAWCCIHKSHSWRFLLMGRSSIRLDVHMWRNWMCMGCSWKCWLGHSRLACSRTFLLLDWAFCVSPHRKYHR
jgi:hypothetical protein